MRRKIPGYDEPPGDLSHEEIWRESIKRSTVKELNEYIANAEKELEDPDWNEENRRQTESQVRVAKEELSSRNVK